MEEKSLKAELEAAYKSLDKADRQIKNLLIERKQNNLILEMLESSGYIKDGKLEEAREFVNRFVGAE